jgi:hypothetical protein
MATVRPNDIQCTQWEPASPGAKACRYYLRPSETESGGLCKLPGELICVEWVRRSGSEAQKRSLVGHHFLKPQASTPNPPSPKDPDEPPPLVLRPLDPLPPRAPARVQVPGGELAMALPRPYEPAKAIDPASLEALEAAGVEVELTAPYLAGTITLVPARTGRVDRNELSYREAAVIRLLVDAFPGSHVTAYRAALPGGVGAPANEVAANGAPALQRCGVCGELQATKHDHGTGPTTAVELFDRLDLPFDEYPLAGSRCSVCGQDQRATAGGLSCSNGHGGAESMVEEDPLS